MEFVLLAGQEQNLPFPVADRNAVGHSFLSRVIGACIVLFHIKAKSCSCDPMIPSLNKNI